MQKKQKETVAFQMKQEKVLEAKLIEEQRKQVIQEEREVEEKEMLEKIKFKQRLDGQLDEKQTKINKAYQVCDVILKHKLQCINFQQIKILTQ